ncbi:acyl-CoA thioesterase II [Truncatella angustata]|uniref:Acyl-CoA thioesterase II n=1 Tax=Truncatella angustata TaxID=152316 RepID=A0A9P8UHB8_9PEZI|nr:acyl-CoA thioesterase II [Truncatella angustata]KAH6652130.1 acyl-CoA thioesterase II [Truncatella angustata]
MSFAALPDIIRDGSPVKRYMSRRAVWVPGVDLPVQMSPWRGKAAYGGHVYSQAGLVASRAFSESRASVQAGQPLRQFGIHTIHGYFSEAGLVDRAFIYEVTTIAANHSFHNVLVKVRQPKTPSTSRNGDHYPLEDAKESLGPVCFSAVVSFRPATRSQLDIQEPSAQTRYANILSLRPSSAWDPAPSVDIAAVLEAFPSREAGSFPIVDMKKVDMTAFNEGKPLYDRRELLLYRLIAPLPASDPDAHIVAHAYEADRNGLLMIGNHIGFGHNFGRAASLSYSFVVHVNPSDAVMKFGEDEWWIQECSFPRVEAGRGIIMSKIWSPSGVHVATEYQDGIIQRPWGPDERQGKL